MTENIAHEAKASQPYLRKGAKYKKSEILVAGY
jgi:hypothetical protein